MNIPRRRAVLDITMYRFSKRHTAHKHFTENLSRWRADTENLKQEIAKISDHQDDKFIARLLCSFGTIQENHCPRSTQRIEWSEVAVIADYLCMLESHADEVSLANQNSAAWKCALLISRRHYPLHEDCHNLTHAEALLKSADSSSAFENVIQTVKASCSGQDEFVPCSSLVKIAQSYLVVEEEQLLQEQVLGEFEAANISLLAECESDPEELDELQYPALELQHETKAKPRITTAAGIVQTATIIEKLGRLSPPHYFTRKSGKTVTGTAGEPDASDIAPAANEPSATITDEARCDPICDENISVDGTRESIRRAPKRNRPWEDGVAHPGRENYKYRIVGPSEEAPRQDLRRRIAYADTEGQISQLIKKNGKETVPVPGPPESGAPEPQDHIGTGNTRSTVFTDSTPPNNGARDAPPTAAKTVTGTVGDLDTHDITRVTTGPWVATPEKGCYSSMSEECASVATLPGQDCQPRRPEGDRQKATFQGGLKAAQFRTLPEARPVPGKLSIEPGPSIETLGLRKRPWDRDVAGLLFEGSTQHKRRKADRLEKDQHPVLTLQEEPLQIFCGPACPDAEGQAFQFTRGNMEEKDLKPKDSEIAVRDGMTIASAPNDSPGQGQDHYTPLSAKNAIVSGIARSPLSGSAQVTVPKEHALRKYDAVERVSFELAATLSNPASSSSRLNEKAQSGTPPYDCGQNSFEASSQDGSQIGAKSTQPTTADKDVTLPKEPSHKTLVGLAIHADLDCHQKRVIPEAADNTTPKIAAADLGGSNVYKESADDKDGLAQPDWHPKDGAYHAVQKNSSEIMQQEVSLLTLRPPEADNQDYKPQEVVQEDCTEAQATGATAADSANAFPGRKRKRASRNAEEGTLVDLRNSELPQPISRPASQNVHMLRGSEADQQQVRNVPRTAGRINNRVEDANVQLDEPLSSLPEAPVPHSFVTWLAPSSDARNPEAFLFTGQTPDNDENADRPTKKTKCTSQPLKVALDRETKRGHRKFGKWHQNPGKKRAADSLTRKQQNPSLIKPSPITARLQNSEVVRHSRFKTAKSFPINFNERINLDLLGSRDAEERCDVKESIFHMNVPTILLEFLKDSKQSQTAISRLLTALENSNFVEYHAALYKTLETADDDTLASLPQSAKVIIKYIKNRISDPHLGPVDQSEIHDAVSFGWDVEVFNHEIKKCVGNLFAVEKQSLQNWSVYIEIFNQQVATMSAENNAKATATAHDVAELRSQLNDLQSTCLSIAAIWGTQQVRPVDEAFQFQLETNMKEFRDQAEAASTMARDMVAFCDHMRLNAIRKCRLDTGEPLPHFRSEGFLENATSIRSQVTNWLNGLADEYELLQERLTVANKSADSAKEIALEETSLIFVLKDLVRSAFPQLESVRVDDVETFRQTSQYHTQAFQESQTARKEIVCVFLRLCNQVESLIENRPWQELPQPELEQHLMDNALRNLPVIRDRFEHLLKNYARVTQFCIETEEKVKTQVFQQQSSKNELPLILWTNLSGLVDNYVRLNDSETELRRNAENMARQLNETVERNRTLEAELSRLQYIPEKLLNIDVHATMKPRLAPSADTRSDVLETHHTFAEKLLALEKDDTSENRIGLIKKHLSGAETAVEKYYLVVLSLIQDGKLHRDSLPPSTRLVLSSLLERKKDSAGTENESNLLFDLCSPWYPSLGERPDTFEVFQKRAQLEEASTGKNDTALVFVIQNFRKVIRDEIGDILYYELGRLMAYQTDAEILESALKTKSDEMQSISAENIALRVMESAVFKAHPELKSRFDLAVRNAQDLRPFQESCEGEIVACKDARENFFQFYRDLRHAISGTEFLQNSSQVVTKEQFLADTVEISSLLLSLKSLVGKYTVSKSSLRQLNDKLVRAMEDCADLKDMAHVKAEEVLGLQNIINEQRKTQGASNEDNQHLEKKIKELEEEAERFKALQQEEKKLYEEELKDKVSTRQLEETRGQLEKVKIQLAETKSRLDETESQLEETKGRLEEAKSQLDETKNHFEETKSQLDKRKSQLEEVRTSEQTMKDRYTSLSNELEIVKKTHTKTEADLTALENKNRETVISTGCLQNKLRVLESQHKQLQEIQRTSASHQDELKKIRAAELTESRQCCEKLQTELHLLKIETASSESTGPLRHGISGNGTADKASMQLLGKKPQISIFATHNTRRRRAVTVPRSSHRVLSHHSYFNQAHQFSLSAEAKNVSKANETKLAIATKQTKADGEVSNEKKLLEADLQQLTDSIRELTCLISRYKDEEFSSKEGMRTLLQQVQAIKEVTSAGRPKHDMKQNIEALKTELRVYQDGVNSFERILRTTKATAFGSLRMAETFEANEIEQRCLHAVATYIDGLFGVDSVIYSEATMSHANLERRLASFAEAGSGSNIEKMQASFQTRKLSALTDISKEEEKYAEVQDRWERTARIANRRKRRLENCLKKVKSTFVEAIAGPNDTKQRVIALCDQCTPIQRTVDPHGKEHKKRCLACEAITAVLNFARAKEDLRVNLLWELTAHLQKRDKPAKALGLESRLRDAQLGVSSALHLCGAITDVETAVRPPRAYELMFRTLQNAQAAALEKAQRKAPQKVTGKKAKCQEEQHIVADTEQNTPEPAIESATANAMTVPVKSSETKTSLEDHTLSISKLIPAPANQSTNEYIIPIAGVEWCICSVTMKKQSQLDCNVVMVQKPATKIGKREVQLTVWIADAMDILEASITGDNARLVADKIYSFCEEHGPDLRRLPPGLRFEGLSGNKPRYRNGVVDHKVKPRDLKAMGPHVRAAFTGVEGSDAVLQLPDRKLIQITLDIRNT